MVVFFLFLRYDVSRASERMIDAAEYNFFPLDAEVHHVSQDGTTDASPLNVVKGSPCSSTDVRHGVLTKKKKTIFIHHEEIACGSGFAGICSCGVWVCLLGCMILYSVCVCICGESVFCAVIGRWGGVLETGCITCSYGSKVIRVFVRYL